MHHITCSALLHRGAERLFFEFEYNSTINGLFRKILGCKWSQTHRQWYLPLSNESYILVKNSLAGIASLDTTELSGYLKKRQVAKPAGINTAVAQEQVVQEKVLEPVKKQVVITPLPAGKITAVNKHILPALKQQLVLKAYSPSTIRTYLNEVGQFLQQLNGHAADELSSQRIRDYLQYCFEKLHLSENTLHSRINALKFYYEQVLKKEKFFWEVPRPKKPFQLPKLLNETELTRLFNALQNKKHKAMLFTAYSAGLRVSEVVALRLESIDSTRMQICVERAKGKKDRYVNLSPVLLDILRTYIKEYKPSPKIFLFESDTTKGAYPTRTVQQVFSQAKHKAGILKTVGVHSLRHSFATHLLDKGTDIRYIKDLLGHFNIRTTERYLHVSKKQLVNIVSPFDDLWKTNSIEW
ncbi:MAG: tyrosine-type recombinase/integrase [Bacteroidota bacterium]